MSPPPDIFERLGNGSLKEIPGTIPDTLWIIAKTLILVAVWVLIGVASGLVVCGLVMGFLYGILPGILALLQWVFPEEAGEDAVEFKALGGSSVGGGGRGTVEN